MVSFQEVLTAAQSLSVGEQVRLIEALHADLPLGDWPAPSAEWLAEANRRSAAYDQGQVETASWPEVRARARKEAGMDG